MKITFQLDPTQAGDAALVAEGLTLPGPRLDIELMGPIGDRQLCAAIAARDDALDLYWTSPAERRRLGYHSTGRVLMMGSSVIAAHTEIGLWKQRAMAELDMEFAPAMWGEVPGR